MIGTQEATAATGVAGGARADKAETVDPEVFARELKAQLSGGGGSKDGVAAVLEKLASAFPGATITTQSTAGFAAARSHIGSSGEQASINLGADILAQMSTDESLFERVRQMATTLLSAGQRQNLVNTGGSVQRSVSIESSEARYVEVHRTSAGTQLSVTALSLETESMVNDILNKMLGARDTSGRQTGQAASSKDTGVTFEDLIGGGNSGWRLEGVISSQALTGAGGQSVGSFGLGRMVQETRTATLEVVIEQWSVAAREGTATGRDLLGYIQMMNLSDPLVFDLGDEGFDLRSAEDGVYFDIKGDGTPVRTGFIQGNNAFLYLDGNGNGTADDAGELFGDVGGFANGFEKLAQYDDNGDGVIDESDKIYSELRLWRDLNADGINRENESMTLAEAGIRSIDLKYRQTYEKDAHGNVIGERGTFIRDDGRTGNIADVWLRSV